LSLVIEKKNSLLRDQAEREGYAAWPPTAMEPEMTLEVLTAVSKKKRNGQVSLSRMLDRRFFVQPESVRQKPPSRLHGGTS
jgi:hypothetical protein